MPHSIPSCTPAASWAAPFDSARQISILGVSITDVARPGALKIMQRMMQAGDERCRCLFFVNAHTLNISVDDPLFRDDLNDADVVFNDGTGVRWAARQRGIELRDNLIGTDLVPAFLDATAGRGHRYFLLGGSNEVIGNAAEAARRRFPGWKLAGCHHGYVRGRSARPIIDKINEARPDLLLVGMGNPLQERWILRQRQRLNVPLAIGVGGLFDYWAGTLQRAPSWIRKLGSEWVHVLVRQPHKWRRYLLGNPKFLFRMTRFLKEDLTRMDRLNRNSSADSFRG